MTFQDYDDDYEYDPRRSADVPEGIYRVKVVELTTANHPAFGEEQARWSFSIVGGEYDRQVLLKWSSLDRTKRHYLFQDLGRCGVAARTMAELEEKRLALEGREIEVKVELRESAKGREYQVVWINGLVRAAPAETPAQTGELRKPLSPRPKLQVIDTTQDGEPPADEDCPF